MTEPIRLCRIAPWKRALTARWRERFAEHCGRYFKVEREGRDGLWEVSEIDADGNFVEYVVMCAGNLPAAKQAIRDVTAGMPRDEITRRALNAPRAGTGRNHPKNVAARRAWR